MKIKLAGIIFVFLTYQFVYSQGVFPSIIDHPVWHVMRSVEPSLPGPVFFIDYRLEKDTIVNEKTFSVILRAGNHQTSQIYSRIGFTRTDAKKVYFKETLQGKEYLLYDFGMNLGDVAYCAFCETDSIKYQVIGIDTVNVEGVIRKRMKVLPEDYPEEYMSMYWIEGIGSEINPFYKQTFGCGGVKDELRCVSKNSTLIFRNPKYSDCTTITGIRHEMTEDNVKIYPNPIADKLIIVNNSRKVESLQIKIFDNHGRIIYSLVVSELNNSIDVSTLDSGHYIIQIQTDSWMKNIEIIKL